MVLKRDQALMLELGLCVPCCSFHKNRDGKGIQIFPFLVPYWPLIEVYSECSVKVINKDLSCLAIIED